MNYDKLFDEGCSYRVQEKDLSYLHDYLLKKKGWTYIAKSANNTLLKIGRTGKNPLDRAKTLSSAGVLHDYEIVFSLPMFNQFIAEKLIHQQLKKFRVSKEFFSVNESTAIDYMQKEYNRQNIMLARFLNIDLLKEDINLLPYSLK